MLTAKQRLGAAAFWALAARSHSVRPAANPPGAVAPSDGPIALFDGFGAREGFPTLRAAVAVLGPRFWLDEVRPGALRPLPPIRQWAPDGEPLAPLRRLGRGPFARGPFGDPVMPADIRAVLAELSAQRKRAARWRFDPLAAWPGLGPVPGVSRSRGRHGRALRRPETAAEKRLNAFALAEDGEPQARAARGPSSLADAFDDIPRDRQRSWKGHRARQRRAGSDALPTRPTLLDWEAAGEGAFDELLLQARTPS